MERLLALAWICVAAGAFFFAGELPKDGAVYPRLIAVIMAVLALSEFFARRTPEATAAPQMDELGEESDSTETTLGWALRFFAVLAAMIWLMAWAGYLVAGAIGCLAMLILVFRERPLRAVVVSVAIIGLTTSIFHFTGIGMPTASW